MKQALVLSGGGAKGAYEAGCLKALQELGYTFDIVTGTSIGALNGLLIAQQDYDKLYKLWDELTLEKVLKNPIHFDFSIESMLKQSNLIMPFFKSYIDKKGADITPLKNMIHELYDGSKAKHSSIHYGLVTVKFPQLKPLEITVDDMTENNIVEYAIASASCFPAFPIHYIDNQGYIDGGYFDNLPISLALKMGAQKIIAIELNQEATHSYFLDRPNITFIRPSHDLGGFLDFDRELLNWRIRLGYYDTLKTFHKLKGYRYTFENHTCPPAIVDQFYQAVLLYENSLNHTLKNRAMGNDITPLIDILKENTYIQTLEIDDYFILGLELTMERYHYPFDQVYRFNDILNQLKNKMTDDSLSDYNRLHLLKKANEALSDLTTGQILNYFYFLIKNKEENSIVPIHLFYKEYIIALFLNCLK